MAKVLSLDDAVQFVKGVGPRRAVAFEALGIRTVRDLIEHYPFRHELRPKSVAIGQLAPGEVATVVGELRRVRTSRGFPRQSVTARVVDGTGECSVRWFNSPYLADLLHEGQTVRLSGKIDEYGGRASLVNPKLEIIPDDQDPFENDTDRFEPIYPASGELPSRLIARTVRTALPDAVESVDEFLPDDLRTHRALPPRRAAILRFHLPTRLEEVDVARRRLAYEELLLFLLAAQIVRRSRAAQQARPLPVSEELDRRIRARFPFELTGGQNAAVGEITADVNKPVPMNRLLQGDVGAGKTAVAVYVALVAIAHRQQVALLAPTEVLVEQHFRKVEGYLAGSRVRVARFTGSTPKGQRSEILDGLGAGRLDLVVGTHALLGRHVRFADLGLVIIDEQQRFGVAQRAALRAKGEAPHTLVLSATPIPRTLAMTLFGDLDISTIHERPPGRQDIVTRVVSPEQQKKAWDFVRTRLAAGEQAYVVYPLVEESENLPLQAAGEEAVRLAQSELSGFEIELLHGRMRPQEKRAVMDRFQAGQARVLVSTTVIEVGVDVPNATIMIVQHAERYGLSQLHQLRGRIGRGSKKSYCLLFSEAAGGASDRLSVLCQTNDGFRIAEEDLRIRGPGELLGRRQHGVPVFKVADLITDLGILVEARDDAHALLAADPSLNQPFHRPLRAELLRRLGDKMGLADTA